MFDIIGLGAIAMDIYLHVNELPKEDEFSMVQKTEYLPGGSGVNVIAQFTRLGGTGGFLAQIGDDKVGNEIIASMKADHVDTNGLLILKGGTSLHCNIIVGPDGKKMILMNLGNSYLNWCSEDLNLNYLKQARIFYTDLTPGGPGLAALKEAKHSGLKTIFNLQVDINVMQKMGVSECEINEALHYTDVFVVNSGRLFQLTKSNTFNDSIPIMRTRFNNLLLCTHGINGSTGFEPNGNITTVPSLKVNTIDTTGAGDSYLGAFAYKYFKENAPLQDSMMFASACAAYTCEHIGARKVPNLEEARTMMNRLIDQVTI